MRRLVALLLAALIAVPAAAQERIAAFDSQLSVREDGTLDVTETIDVVSEGAAIRHGIYRDFPTRYRLPKGGQTKIAFTLGGTERDGRSEPSGVERLSNGVRIKVGDADTLVEPGPHRYVIRYHVTRELGRFDGYDELYWNVTGNGWAFPIDRASATIVLPSPVRFGERAAYTGAQGVSGGDARVTAEGAGTISFATTRPLGPGEGLTVAAAFPKGVVDPETQASRTMRFLADYAPHTLGALGLLATLGFVFFAWNRVGRDPGKGTVVPLFSPPDGLSPAAMRYIDTMSFDDRAFAATLVDWGVRGQLRLAEEDGGWLSGAKRRIIRTSAREALAGPEAEALQTLTGSEGSVEMDNENHERFSAAMETLTKDLKSRFDGTMFNRNSSWAAAGLGVMLAFAWLTALTYSIVNGMALAPLGALSGAGLAVGALLLWLASRSGTAGKCLFGALGFIFVLAGVAASFPLAADAMIAGGVVPILMPLLALPAVLLGFWLMSAPTPAGRAVMDRIAGFKQYLSIAEGERLDRMTGATDAPPETLQTFERLLPYAIALGVENKWADRFAAQLAAATVAQQAGAFAWYSGSHQPWSDAGGFVDDIGGSLSSSISSSSTAPGSSSGSGGGGFSGGGGGGGGGGGW